MKRRLAISQRVPGLDNQLLGRGIVGHTGVLGNLTFCPGILPCNLCQITCPPEQTKLSSLHPQIHWFNHLKNVGAIIAFENCCFWKSLVKIANLYCPWEMLDASLYVIVESPMPWNLSPEREGNSNNKEFLKEKKTLSFALRCCWITDKWWKSTQGSSKYILLWRDKWFILVVTKILEVSCFITAFYLEKGILILNKTFFCLLHVPIRKFMHECMQCERNKLYKIHSAKGREYRAIYPLTTS